MSHGSSFGGAGGDTRTSERLRVDQTPTVAIAEQIEEARGTACTPF